jgi:hypothetical protein
MLDAVLMVPSATVANMVPSVKFMVYAICVTPCPVGIYGLILYPYLCRAQISQGLYPDRVIYLDLPVKAFLHRMEDHMCYQHEIITGSFPGLESQFIKNKFTVEIG